MKTGSYLWNAIVEVSRNRDFYLGNQIRVGSCCFNNQCKNHKKFHDLKNFPFETLTSLQHATERINVKIHGFNFSTSVICNLSPNKNAENKFKY